MRRHRWIATLVVVGCLASPLLDLVHAASGRHIECAQHGDLEDVPALAHRGEVARPEPTCDRQPAPPRGRDHEGCAIVAHGRQVGSFSIRHARPTALRRDVPLAAILAAEPHPRLIVHRVAPKTSPPA